MVINVRSLGSTVTKIDEEYSVHVGGGGGTGDINIQPESGEVWEIYVGAQADVYANGNKVTAYLDTTLNGSVTSIKISDSVDGYDPIVVGPLKIANDHYLRLRWYNASGGWSYLRARVVGLKW